MKNPAWFPGPGLGTLLKVIFLYMGPVSTSRSHKLHRSTEVTICTTQRLYSASQELPVPTLNRVLRGLVPSGPAECLAHPLVRLRWVHITREGSLVVERLCEHQQKLLKRREVFTLDRRLDHGLNSMIARYDGASTGRPRARRATESGTSAPPSPNAWIPARTRIWFLMPSSRSTPETGSCQRSRW